MANRQPAVYDMERWIGRVALVTGAASGIGAAITRKLTEHGMIVYGCDLFPDKIEEMSKELKGSSARGQLYPYKCNLKEESEILDMFEEIKKQHGGVDVCVNNAGLNHASTLLEGKTSHWRNIVDVNILAVAICARESVKQMRERNIDDGHIIIMGSMAGHYIPPVSLEHFYTGSKHMVKVLTEGLRRELKELKSHIKVTSISPSNVQTGFFSHMYQSDGISEQIYAEYEHLQPSNIADMMIYALQAPAHVQVQDVLVSSTFEKK
ncbi:dehydrogenase/reductase SDR family member 11-like [Glandiceps talaboti]